jgi:Protein of unknown function (DUF3592)
MKTSKYGERRCSRTLRRCQPNPSRNATTPSGTHELPRKGLRASDTRGLLMITALTAKDYFHPTASWQKETFVSFFRLLCGLAVVLGLLQWRIYVRHRHLVSNGEVVLGRITKNYGSARNGQYLRYEFNTQSGETLSKTRTSWRLLDVGMRIPVFYDPYNPKKQVALFAAYYEVKLRGQS